MSKNADLLRNGVKPNRSGRKPGQKNRFTTLKAAFLEAFERTGGVDGLVSWIQESRQNRGTFYQLVTRLFPQEVAHSGSDGSGAIRIEVVHVKGEGGNGNGNGDAK